MKLFALLCFVGLAAASNQINWETGKEYTFGYEGRMLTGLPELATHYSGLGLKCNVHLTVLRGNDNGQSESQFSIRLSDAMYARVNQQLQGQGTSSMDNWRNLNLPGYVNIPVSSGQALEKPSMFKLKPSGQFESITVSGDEPEWSINFKKALIVLFQTKSVSGSSSQQGEQQEQQGFSNMIGSSSGSGSGVGNGNSIDFWKTQEQSLDGVCDVTYQVNKMEAYMVRDQPQLVLKQENCGANQQYWEIVRSRDVSSCSSRTSFSSYKPGFFRCSTGNCEGMWSRSSITRYIACGSRDNLQIQTIINEGELEQDLFGSKTEKFLTGAKQTLRLQSVKSRQGSEASQQPSNPITKKSLNYEYDIKATQQLHQQQQQQGEQGVGIQQQLIGQEHQEKISKALPAHLLTLGSPNGQQQQQQQQGQSPTKDQIKQQIKKVITQLVSDDLEHMEDIPKKEVTMKALGLARGFAILNKSDIQGLYDELKGQFSGRQQQTMKNVFFDTVMMSGTFSSVQFLKTMVQQQEIGQFHIAAIFTFMPNYIIAPTSDMLNEIFELVKSEQILNNPLTYNQAILGFTSLVSKACLADNRKTSYPTFVYGEFCNGDSQIVVERLIPFLQQQLQQSSNSVEKKNAIIVALGVLGHRNVISILAPYVEGTKTVTGSGSPTSSENQLGRFLAVYSLVKAGIYHPHLVEPIVFAVLSNQAESTEVRVAAFNSLLRMNPSQTYFHRMAALTWREKNEKVLEVINSAFLTLSLQKDVEPANRAISTLPRKAWLVYPLIKKITAKIPSTGTLYTADYMPALGVGFEQVTSWFSDKESYVPAHLYTRIVYLLDRFQFSPAEIGYRFKGAENMIQQIVEMLTPGQQHEGRQSFEQQIKQQLGGQWKKVIESLNIKTESGNTMASGAFVANLFEAAPIFQTLQSSNGQTLEQKIRQLMGKQSGSIKDAFCGQHNVNMQRMINFAPQEFLIPSEIGFPIVIEVHAPVAISARGNVNIDCNSQTGAIPNVELNLRYMTAMQLTGWVGTVLPFTGEFLVTGVDQHNVVNVPAKFDLKFNTQEQKVQLKLQSQQGSRPVDMLHFHVRPYTVAQKLGDLEPMTLNHNVQWIKSPKQAVTKTMKFGQQSLGLDFNAMLRTESRFTDFAALVERMRMFNNNPLNVARFSLVSSALSEKLTPSLRMHEFKLRFDPATSATKEIDLNLKWGYATKMDGEQIQYHQLKQGSPQQLKSFPQWKKLIPVQVVSEDIQSGSGSHQERRQKIKNMMEKISVQSGTGLTVNVKCALVGGSRSRVFSWSANYASGLEQLKQKWNLSFEQENSEGQKKICIVGDVQLPVTPIFSIHQIRNANLAFNYNNVIGWGNQCQEKTIKMTGTSRVSGEQKRHSETSKEARQLEKLIQKNAPLAEMSELAEKVRQQAATLDEIDFSVEWNNVGQKAIKVPEYVSEYTKALLWPYYVISESRVAQSSASGRGQGAGSGSGNNLNKHWRVRFSQNAPTFDLTVSSSQQDEKMVFKSVRIPNFVQYFYPASALTKAARLVRNVNPNFFPACKVEQQWIQTYDNLTTRHAVDDCFHLLSADCSYRKNFAILVRNLDASSSRQSQSSSAKELKVLIGKTEILLAPSGSHSRFASSIKVVVNGTQIQLQQGKKTFIKDSKKAYIADVVLSKDGAVSLQMLYSQISGSPSVTVTFDGQKIKTETSRAYTGGLCGLCGGLSGNKLDGFKGPEECFYSKPETIAASYRVQSLKQCSSLPSHIQSEYRKEKEQCLKDNVIPTKIVKAYEQLAGPCTRHAHEILERPSEHCFSKKPVTECGPRCKPSSQSKKSVEFVCMQKSRLSERYVEKAREGEQMPELENLPVSFATQVKLPRTCQPVA